MVLIAAWPINAQGGNMAKKHKPSPTRPSPVPTRKPPRDNRTPVVHRPIRQPGR